MKNVYILGTIHKTHETNKNYGYHHILEEVKQYSPDILCVEIRAQDMTEENSYLREYYPAEMVLLKEEYEKNIPIYGFDWRGYEMEQHRMGERPSNALDIFTLMQKDPLVKDLIMKRKAFMNPFFETCTLASCQTDYGVNYEKIQSIEEELDQYLCGQGFENLVTYNREREICIQQNIHNIVKNNPHKRIMIITGISHKDKLVDYLS
ncbi:MAG: hypothetical protein ACK5JH_08200 [Anaerocolumna sp.]